MENTECKTPSSVCYRKEQGKRKSPLRSPRQRLCEEEPEICSLTDLNSRRELDFYEHTPRPPSGISSSKKSGKQRLIGPEESKKYEEYLGMAKRFEEMRQFYLKKEEEQSQCIQDLENDINIHQIKNVLLQKEIEKLNCSYNTMKAENAKVKYIQNEVDAKTKEVNSLRMQLVSSECLSLEIKILRREKANVEQQNSELTEALQAKTVEIESLIKHLERIETLSKECEKQGRTREKGEHEMTELEQVVQKKTNEVEDLTTGYEEKISTLTKTVEDIKGSKNQAADENIKGLQKKIGSLESELRNATTEMNDLSYKYKCLQKDKESADYTINKLSRNVQEKGMEISLLIEHLAKSNENVDREEHTASANSIQKLNEENTSLKSKLSQLSHETEKKVSALTKEIKSLQKSKGTSSEEYNARKLYEENEFLKVQLDRTSRSYEQLRKDYNEVKLEKDRALNSYDQKGRDSNEVKRERDHNLKRFNSVAGGYGHRGPKGLL